MTQEAPKILIEDGSPALQGERVAFTGTLASMTHETAQQLTEENGGTATHNVSRKTTLLVVGEEGWPIEPDGKPSQKLLQVEEWNASGDSIQILNESDWLRLIGLRDPADDQLRTYTPAMLSTLLEIPVSLIRRWERKGLIKPVKRIHKLPYFDYEEVNSVRRLSQLIDNGAEPREIERSLTHLGKLLGDSDRKLAQLNLLVQDRQVIVRDEKGLLQPRTGQRWFDFEPGKTNDADSKDDSDPDDSPNIVAIEFEDVEDDRVRWTADDWFIEGCRYSDANELQPAIEAFRLALTAERNCDAHQASQTHPAEVNFHLADALYRLNKIEAAIERYYCCVECDNNYLEAWTQLGCLLAETNQLTAAIEAFQIALDLHPQYADAHWHLANVLKQQGQTQDARKHWQMYLDFDQFGPWADGARQAMGIEPSSV